VNLHLFFVAAIFDKPVLQRRRLTRVHLHDIRILFAMIGTRN
jgi:hypothetical protein